MSLTDRTKVGETLDWIDSRIPDMFVEAVSALEQNPDMKLEEQDATKSLRCYPRIPEDGLIDWGDDNVVIDRLIRASSEPFSGAFCELDGKRFIIWDAELLEDRESYLAVPGQIASIQQSDGSIIVITGNGKLKLTDIEYDGNRCAPAEVIKSIRSRLT